MFQDIANVDRLFVYLWEDITRPLRSKFGQRWVPAGVDAISSINARIQESMGVLHDDFSNVKVWLTRDVSDIAKRVNKFHKKSKIDDFIRIKLPNRIANTEFHEVSAPEMVNLINARLDELQQPRREVGLSTMQYDIAVEMIDCYRAGKKVVLGELCPRFGKTLGASCVPVEMDVDLVIVASYVTTVFTSFENDITSYKNFEEYVSVDTRDENYEEIITNAFSNGKKVFAYLSLNQSEHRQSYIDFLADLPCTKMLIVDEADFGAHQIKQAKPLVDKRDKIDYILLMTGTDSARASTYWPIDHYLSVTYAELLIQKEITRNAYEI
jgi:hypothetical protein